MITSYSNFHVVKTNRSDFTFTTIRFIFLAINIGLIIVSYRGFQLSGGFSYRVVSVIWWFQLSGVLVFGWFRLSGVSVIEDHTVLLVPPLHRVYFS